MKYHTVSQGEHLASIALSYGFRDWNTVYQHPNNDAFRKKRPNPNVILPGDQIFIPDIEEKTLSRATGQLHVFHRMNAPHCVRIVLKDADGKPFANTKYKLTVGDQEYAGVTDKDGLVYKEIAKTTQDAELRLEDLGLGWALKIGHLDPLHEPEQDTPIITGVKARLKNLGFYDGEVDQDFDDDTQEAVKQFQQTVLNRTDPDGQLDADTLNALQQQHGS
jgi:N-acetylmuramoyl-L-alanine amidase